MDWTPILLGAIGLLGTASTAYFTYLGRKIHNAVNGEREALLSEIRKLREAVEALNNKGRK